MLDIAICDDDNSFAGGLEKTLCRMEKTYGLKFEIDVYQDCLLYTSPSPRD